MAVKAYVLMNLVTSDPARTMEQLKKISGVKNADAVIGPFDAITVIEADNMDLLGRMVVEKILSVDGVSKTLTCVKL